MLKNVTGQETDTFDEINKVMNKIIDNLNVVETEVLRMSAANKKHNAAVDKYNAAVDKYNKSVNEPNKKGDK